MPIEILDVSYEIQLNILPAYQGDCIHLRFGNKDTYYNIVVDSGTSAFSGQFFQLLSKIRQRGEKIDLLCFSHIDDDHIGGAVQAFSHPAFKKEMVDKVWINVPEDWKVDGNTVPIYKLTSVGSAFELWKLMTAHQLKIVSSVKQGDEIYLGQAKVQVLLPTLENLEKCFEKWKKDETLLKNRKGYFLTAGGKKDRSLYNGSSIVLLVSIGQRKILLTGDAHADDLTECCSQYLDSEACTLVKLPHHGSEGNVTMEMLESMNANHFLISTRETAKRPGNMTFDLLQDYASLHGKVKVYGNYAWGRVENSSSDLEIIPLRKQTESIVIDGVEIFSE